MYNLNSFSLFKDKTHNEFRELPYKKLIRMKKINYVLKEKRIGELDYTCCLNNKIQKEVNWKPKKTMDDIWNDLLKYWRKKV